MNCICCDVDGTLTEFEKFVLEYGKKFFKVFYNISDLDINFQGYDLDEVFFSENLILYFSKNYNLSPEDILEKFWNYYYIFYVTKRLKKGASNFFDELCKNNKLLITTSRKKSTANSVLGLFVRQTIIAQLKFNLIHYDDIYFFENDNDKLDFIKRQRPLLVFDDKPLIIDELLAHGEKVVCIDSSYNKNCDERAIRISNYDENACTIVKRRM